MRKSTSIRLPADLLKEAKHRAVDEGTTVQNLIVEGLKMRLAAKSAKEDKQ